MAACAVMLAGYAGDDAGNGQRLATVVSGTRAQLCIAAAPRVGVAAPWFRRLDDGGMVGLAGRLLPLREPADNLVQTLCADVARRGPEALAEVDGHWALAASGCDRRKLTLAHDPFGGCNLYYAWAGATLWYSTSFRALMALPEIARTRELDLGALHGYLALSYVPAPRTLVANIQCVPPATALVFDLREGARREPRSISLFAPPSRPPETAGWDEPRWREALAERYQAAIRKRLPDRQTPVAVALSGGLDSSAIAASLVTEDVDVTALHLDFGAPFDEERPFATQVAAHLGVPLHAVPVTIAGKNAARQLHQAVWHMDQPYGDPVTLPLFLAGRAMARQGFTIGFNGEGGDQLFAGWPNKAMLAAEVYGAPPMPRRARGHTWRRSITFPRQRRRRRCMAPISSTRLWIPT